MSWQKYVLTCEIEVISVKVNIEHGDDDESICVSSNIEHDHSHQ
jgi:hypothetical protein